MNNALFWTNISQNTCELGRNIHGYDDSKKQTYDPHPYPAKCN